MLFGISEEYIGLLLVIAVCLITVTIIAVHEGWFSTAPQRATPRGRQRTSPEVQDQPEQVQRTPHQPEGLRQRRGPQRVRGSAEFVRYRLLPYLPREDPELTEGVQTAGPSAQKESSTFLVSATHRDLYTQISTVGCKFEDTSKTFKNLQEDTRRQAVRTQRAAIVLFLEDDEDSFEYDPPYEENPKKLFVPQNDKFVNYIIARPNSSKGAAGHAERIIMRNFGSLERGFQAKNNNQHPAKILLYSELMPCKTCTDAIIKTLSQWAQRVKVELNYSQPYYRETEHEERGNIDRLKQSGISVDRTCT